ncbi:MAG: hypothetical protein F4056_05660 [Chloroflexi bacterium]|nr:hypothetical protein [Chloroflexota bacterium]
MQHLTVRNVPDDVIRALREEASETGRSLNVVARTALQEHVERRRSRQRLADGVRAVDSLRSRIKERAGGALSDSVSLIREDRER